MRNSGRLRLGFFPLPLAEAVRIRGFLKFPAGAFSAMDPCVGEGAAFSQITADSPVRRYGIELDAYRAQQARAVAEVVIQGSCFDVHCPVGSFSLLYLNPPYDFEIGEGQNRRMELIFLEYTYRWLKPGGVLIFVIPRERIQDCIPVLASHFHSLRIYQLMEPESTRYHQTVIFAVRRTRRERDRLQDRDIQQARRYLLGLSDHGTQLPPLPSEPDYQYEVPESRPVTLTYHGLPLDQIEDLLLKLAAYRQASRILFGNTTSVEGQPLTPLHGGHVGLLCTAGMLNGIFGEGKDRHIAHWQSIKVVDHTEETDEDGSVTLRDRERFTHQVSLVFADGRTATLS